MSFLRLLRDRYIKCTSRRMSADWDQRARDNALHYVNTARTDWPDAEFFETGEQIVREQILNDLTNICQDNRPEKMRVLEIGCGVGRVTRALAKQFGEVHGVDVSAEMVARARENVSSFPNAHVHHNSGVDLAVLGHMRFDFAFSCIVFQHIPSKKIIEGYIREVGHRLRDGALFKFQVQGGRFPPWSSILPRGTWVGPSFSEQEAVRIAERCGFEARYLHGAGTQEFWLWFFIRNRPRSDDSAQVTR